jgi:hypothetical protein
LEEHRLTLPLAAGLVIGLVVWRVGLERGLAPAPI